MLEAAGRDERVQFVLLAGGDVLLREVAAVRGQHRAVGQLGADRHKVLIQLLERRLKLTLIGGLIRQLRDDDHLSDAVNDRLA